MIEAHGDHDRRREGLIGLEVERHRGALHRDHVHVLRRGIAVPHMLSEHVQCVGDVGHSDGAARVAFFRPDEQLDRAHAGGADGADVDLERDAAIGETSRCTQRDDQCSPHCDQDTAAGSAVLQAALGRRDRSAGVRFVHYFAHTWTRARRPPAKFRYLNSIHLIVRSSPGRSITFVRVSSRKIALTSG